MPRFALLTKSLALWAKTALATCIYIRTAIDSKGV